MTPERDLERSVTLLDGQRVEAAPAVARAVARFVDSLIHAALGIGGLLLIFVATFCIWCGSHETNNGLAGLGASLLVVWLLYEPAMTALRGQTLGKAICRIRIVRVADGETPNVGQAFVRWAIPTAAGVAVTFVTGPMVSTISSDAVRLGIMFAAWGPLYLTSFLDDRLRGWHDKAARTIVVRVSDHARHRSASGPPATDDERHTPQQVPNETQKSWGLVSDYYTSPSEPPPEMPSRS